MHIIAGLICFEIGFLVPNPSVTMSDDWLLFLFTISFPLSESTESAERIVTMAVLWIDPPPVAFGRFYFFLFFFGQLKHYK